MTPDTSVTERVAEDLTQQIDDAYSAATENVCTCGSDPEGWCRYCGEWEKARRFTRAAISSMPALEEENARLREVLILARNRLQMAAVNATASGESDAYDYQDWANEAHAALSPRKEDQQPALKEGASREG